MSFIYIYILFYFYFYFLEKDVSGAFFFRVEIILFQSGISFLEWYIFFRLEILHYFQSANAIFLFRLEILSLFFFFFFSECKCHILFLSSNIQLSRVKILHSFSEYKYYILFRSTNTTFFIVKIQMAPPPSLSE